MSCVYTEDVISRTRRRKLRLGMFLGSLVVVAVALSIRYYWGADRANANPPAQGSAAGRATTGAAASRATPSSPSATSPSAATANRKSQPKTVAMVNGRQVSREVLGRECLRRYGVQVLESVVNKYLIAQECQRRGIVISRADVDAEVARMATRFSIPKDEWLTLLESERGINPTQYAEDVIWPILALRRLASDRLAVTPEELREEYEARYGAAVDARLISCSTLEKARQVRAKVVADPEQFPKLAKQYSEDAPSASLGGRIQPIRKHGNFPEIEQAAFTMQDGEISPVIPAGGQFVIIQRSHLLPGARVVDSAKVAPKLEELVRDRKLREVSRDVFRQLQQQAKVVNVMDDPVKSRAMPGVAATINGQQITVNKLAEECIERHGPEVLEGTINRTLIEQACEKQKITITPQDIDQEIARAAADSLPLKDGKPDIEAWLELVTEQQGVSADVYRRDAVWPSIALRKLASGSVKLTEEDLAKGFEANYGPRVRCRAIVMSDLRRAQRVWEMAREKPTVEHFGELAVEYSIEPGSRALRGEIPPIKKHGGQPLLEQEAFALKPGELSGVVQLGERYAILYCEGRTKPVEVEMASVRDLIYKDLHEKKLRAAMAEYFRRLQDAATIDNLLTGTSQRPKQAAGPMPAPGTPKLRQVPGRG
ncbi:MAG: peptidylprolyl isomerase [Pirellulales bacterium]|nr:peptidylprolyl isomerase [Pirellulales bacterium]